MVSTKDLFGVMLAAAGQRPTTETILNASYRAARPMALAEHFYYPHRADVAARYKQNLLAAVVGGQKFVLRREGPLRYNLSNDPSELQPEPTTLDAVVAAIRASGGSAASVDATIAHIRTWQDRGQGSGVIDRERTVALRSRATPDSVGRATATT